MAEVTPPLQARPTLGLCVITREWTEELAAQLAEVAEPFDAIYVQVNGGDKLPRSRGKLKFSEYTWRRDFADARNALLGEVKTDYWTWMDTDDTIRHAERLPGIVERMAETDTQIMFAPYEYARQGEIVTELQLRERIIKTSCFGQWYGAVHETWIPDNGPARQTTDRVVWEHQTRPDHLRESMIRNRQILEAEYKKEPRDPRTCYYLGLNYGMDGHYREAIECFSELIATSGWDEEIYRSWIQTFSCAFELKDYDLAELAAFKAMTVLPDWPDAYLMLQQLHYTLDDHAKSLEWYRVGMAKPTPQSDSAYNPVVREYQPRELAAYSYLAEGDPEAALRAAQELALVKPVYQLKPALKAEILRQVNATRAIKAAKLLMEIVPEPRSVLEALPPELKADIRLTEERRKYIPGKKWPPGSVVFYCGPSFEPWGPDTLDNGMGGSEEAVVYLARELAELGLDVTVYNQRTMGLLDQWDGDDPGDDEPMDAEGGIVTYWPWTEINPADTFDTFIAWRSPGGIQNIKARRKLVDLHDIIAQEDVYAAIPYVDTFCFKSQFHRSLYPEVPDEKVAIVGNGIRPGDVA